MRYLKSQEVNISDPGKHWFLDTIFVPIETYVLEIASCCFSVCPVLLLAAANESNTAMIRGNYFRHQLPPKCLIELNGNREGFVPLPTHCTPWKLLSNVMFPCRHSIWSPVSDRLSLGHMVFQHLLEKPTILLTPTHNRAAFLTAALRTLHTLHLPMQTSVLNPSFWPGETCRWSKSPQRHLEISRVTRWLA